MHRGRVGPRLHTAAGRLSAQPIRQDVHDDARRIHLSWILAVLIVHSIRSDVIHGYRHEMGEGDTPAFMGGGEDDVKIHLT